MAAPAPPAPPQGFFQRLLSLLTPGPFAWVAKSGPPKQRFHAGQHLHGLEEHDLPEGQGAFKGSGILDIRRDWGQDPPAR